MIPSSWRSISLSVPMYGEDFSGVGLQSTPNHALKSQGVLVKDYDHGVCPAVKEFGYVTDFLV